MTKQSERNLSPSLSKKKRGDTEIVHQTGILFLVLLLDTATINIPHQCPWEQLLGVDVHPYRSNQKLATITAGSVLLAQLHLQVAVSTVCTHSDNE